MNKNNSHMSSAINLSLSTLFPWRPRNLYFRQIPIARSLAAGPTNHQAEQQQQLLALQLALVSARGSLAFWRPNQADGPAAGAADPPATLLDPTAAAAPQLQQHNSRPSQIINSHSKCPQLSSSSSFVKLLSSPSAAAATELLAVEGSSVKLNFVIVGSLKQQQPAKQQATSQPPQLAGSKLSFRWTKNGQPLPVVSSPGQHQGALSSAAQHQHQQHQQQRMLHSQRPSAALAAFSESIINENDIIRRYFANLPASSMSSSSANNGSSHSPLAGTNLVDSDSPFLLAPHFDERQIARLRLDPQLESSLKMYPSPASASAQKPIFRWHHQTQRPQQQQQHQAASLLDDFLADAQSIDWQRLESYLKQQASQLRLYLPADEETSAGGFRPKDCPQLLAGHQIEQLTIVQLETNGRLSSHDAGLYSLEACSVSGSGLSAASRNCQSMSFRLHVAQDWPILERTFEHQILEVGDRLSIKCEATGFTLPQITWFLDGQQLNEHKLPVSHHHQVDLRLDGPAGSAGAAEEADGGELAAAASMTSGNLRVGDYVSQDNHVHSFVNSSRLQLQDGGLYRCQANNGFHLVEHEARIDVRGPAIMARQLANQSLLLSVNSQLRVQCPFSGYPITSIEWFFRPGSSSVQRAHSPSPADSSGGGGAAAEEDEFGDHFGYTSQGGGRSKRLSQQQVESGWPDESGYPMLGARQPLLPAASLDDREPDPERDEWLSQAQAMTPPSEPPAPPPDDYPSDLSSADYMPANEEFADSAGSLMQPADDGMLDYGDLQMDLQQQSVLDRRKRAAATADLSPEEQQQQQQQWIKLPQSRRHQVHQNGTLIIHELSRYDQGFYKCRVGGQSAPSSNHIGQPEQPQTSRLASSNEFHLSILVPPVISPFSSADSLREGMRNFLTCSVIEGDSPIRLNWLKDNQPIDDYIRSSDLSAASNQNDNGNNNRPTDDLPLSTGSGGGGGSSSRRIRVETSNEYTSTLYFSHVDFRDNGNYTCMATNKAASVNYTTRMLVNVPPKWVKVPKDLEFTAGQNIVIDCQAKAYPSARVWWEIGISASSPSSMGDSGSNKTSPQQQKAASGEKVSQLPAAAAASALTRSQPNQHQHPPLHYRTIISNSRIHILENASLVIRDLQPNDQGYYLCQAANNFGSLSSLIKLTVNVGASFTSKYLLKYAKLGERVELDCDPNGQSPLEVSWLWRQPPPANSKPPGQGPSSGHATAATMLHHHSTSQNNSQQLFTGFLQQHESSERKSAFDSTPEASELTTGLQMAALAAKISFELVGSTATGPQLLGYQAVRLIIGAATRQHSAEFICKASNRYGSDEKLIKLLVQEPPDQVRDLQPVHVESKSVSISWPIPFTGNTPITGYTVEWAQAASSSSALSLSGDTQQSAVSVPRKWSQMQVQQPAATITDLSPMSSYEIRVRAHNQLGESSPPEQSSSPLLITTGEEVPNAPPSDIRAVPLSSSSIQLSWLAPATPAESPFKLQPSIKGYYLGYRMANSSSASSSSSSSVDFVYKNVPLSDSTSSRQIDEERLAQLPVDLEPTLQNATSQPDQLAAGGRSANRIRVVIDDLKRATKYSIIVQAFNSAGPGPHSDPIEARTLLDDPPPMPMLRVGSITFSSIELQWNFMTSNNNNQYNFYSAGLETPSTRTSDSGNNNGSSETPTILVEGFQLYYRSTTHSSTGAWLEKKLTPETHTMLSGATSSSHETISIVPITIDGEQPAQSRHHNSQQVIGWQTNSSGLKSSPHHHLTATMRFVLEQLVCGNSYQIYLVAHNAIGSGQPSQIVRTKTRGSAPIAPRKQDFLVPNSTLALLNLDSWADGGCQISNFEVRYKQRADPSPAVSSFPRVGHPASASLVSQTGSSLQQQQQQDRTSPWLLVANQIGPDQRQLELRDLQPESWYSVWVLAESVAGRSEAQYTFMTLDKFGRLPLEALEIGTNTMMANGNGNSNMHALFSRYGNGSLVRSLLFGSSSSNVAGVPPMLMSACLALILFATCSLFLIRRYNRQQQQQHFANELHHNASSADNNNVASSIKDNNGSIDSDGRLGACPSSFSSHYHHSEHQHNHHNHNHHQQRLCGQVGFNIATNAQVISSSGHAEHLPAYGGPTNHKPLSSLSMMEAGSSSDYGQSNGVGGGEANFSAAAQTGNLSASPCKTSTTILTGSSQHSTSNGSSSNGQPGVSLCGANLGSFRSTPSQAAQSALDLSRFMGDVAAAAAAAASNQHLTNYHQPPASGQLNSSSLTYRHSSDQQQLASAAANRGLELVDDASPPPETSGRMKLSNDSMQQRFKTMPHRQLAGCPNGGAADNEPVQYSPVATYCNAVDQFNQQQQQIYSKLRLLQCNNNYCQQRPVYDANTINLAVLSQQHRQSLFSNCQTLNLHSNKRNQQRGNRAPAASCNLYDPDGQQLDYNRQTLGQLEGEVIGSPLDDSYGPATPALGEQTALGNGNGYGGPQPLPAAYGQISSSIVSGSISTGADPAAAKQHHLSIESSSENSSQQREQEQLISLTNEVNAIGAGCSANQCAKSPVNNEQTPSDYALPFPPKWV